MARRSVLPLCVGALALGYAVLASADFIGYYDVSNWTTTVDPLDSNASVDTNGEPLSIKLTSGDNADWVAFHSTVDFTIAAAATGTVSFHWNYTSFDLAGGPHWDPFGYLLNGLFEQLANDEGAAVSSRESLAPRDRR